MPGGRPKKDLTELKDKLVALITELSRPATAAKDDELADRLGVPVAELKRALKEAIVEDRIIRRLSSHRGAAGFTSDRTLHVHAARQAPPATGATSPPAGFGRPAFNCIVCGEPLPR